MNMQNIRTCVLDADHATTRLATLDDLDRIMEIEQSSFSLSWSRKEMALEVEHESTRFFVAMLVTNIIGFAAFRINDVQALVSKIAIDPNLRGKGYGRTLMTRLLCVAQELGLATVTLYVRTTNTVAFRLYETLGFHHRHTIKRYYYDTLEDAVVMTKQTAPTNNIPAVAKQVEPTPR